MRGLTYKTHAGFLESFTSYVKQKTRIWHCNPIGRDSGFKIRKVWIRIPPVLPISFQFLDWWKCYQKCILGRGRYWINDLNIAQVV